MQVHEKMLNITNYWRNANQNNNEILPHTGQNGYHQKLKIELPYDPAIPLLGIYQKKTKTLI